MAKNKVTNNLFGTIMKETRQENQDQTKAQPASSGQPEAEKKQVNTTPARTEKPKEGPNAVPVPAKQAQVPPKKEEANAQMQTSAEQRPQTPQQTPPQAAAPQSVSTQAPPAQPQDPVERSLASARRKLVFAGQYRPKEVYGAKATTFLTPEMYAKFKIKCLMNNVSMSEFLRYCIEGGVEEDESGDNA